MTHQALHYLDYAATSAIRPPEVAEAVSRFFSEVGATPGRGGHRLALEAGRLTLGCRQAITRVLGVPDDPRRVVFTQNATQALNTALSGILVEGDRVVTTAFDHNSVLRPLHRLERTRGISVRIIPGDSGGNVDLAEAEVALDGARLLVVNAVSNVLGTRLPLRPLAELAHAAGALVLVDAAQWAGHFQESLSELGADLVAFTGHKGLLGPQGIGGLWVRNGLEPGPFFAGGTGGNSNSREMPEALPSRLEAGSLNAPGIAGLLAGLSYLEREGIATLWEREMELKGRLREGLEAVPGVRVLSPEGRDGVGIVTVVSDRVDPPTMAQELDRGWGVLVRHGLNCAPEVHEILGTSDLGVLRLSVGWASTRDDVDQAILGIDAITMKVASS